MSILQAIILSLVEGITEFLPISSTGHMILASNLMGITPTAFVKSFEIIIQLGAISAVGILYFHTLIKQVALWPKLLVAFLPTALIGYLCYNIIKQVLLGSVMVTVIALFGGGILFFILEAYMRKKPMETTTIDQITYRQSFIIGCFQSISIIPGVSRSAASIFGAMILGTNRQTAVEFSFLLAIPTMIAATGFELFKTGMSFSSHEWGVILVGFISAFITAFISIKTFLTFIKSHTFIPFAWYRIGIAIVFFLLMR